MLMKEFIPAVALQKYIHRYWIVESAEAMPAEKCVMDGFVKLFVYTGEPPVAFYSKPHPIESVYVSRAWRNLK
jgi:hypothetical protein